MSSHKFNTQKAGLKRDQPFFVGQEIKLTIERLSYNGGRGVARLNNFVFFVEDVIRGEVIKAKIKTLKKNFAECDCLEIISPSIHRRTPLCPVAQACGGCTWQHLTYEQQILEKQEIFTSFLQRVNQTDPILLKPIVTCSKEFNYRNRIQLHVQNKKMGYFKKKSHSFIPIDKCFIADDRINEALSSVPPTTSNKVEIAITKNHTIDYRFKNQKNKYDFFSQVNNEQNSRLTKEVNSLIEVAHSKNIYDLYCGTGNFSHPLASNNPQAQVTGVELNKASLHAASKNNNSPNLKFICQNVEDFLSTNPLPKDAIIIIDPPRDGCSHKVLLTITEAKPMKLIYISCNLSTLVRDLNILTKQGMKVISSQAFDMFPQTDHIESLSLLAWT